MKRIGALFGVIVFVLMMAGCGDKTPNTMMLWTDDRIIDMDDYINTKVINEIDDYFALNMDEQLKGKVRTFSQKSYEAKEKFGKPEKGDILDEGNFSKMFDKNGRLLEEAVYGDDGDLYHANVITYNASGDVEEIKIYGFVFGWDTDSDGNRIRFSDPRRLTNSSKCEYIKKGVLSNTKTKDELYPDLSHYNQSFTYDLNKRIIEFDNFHNGELLMKNFAEYDKKGRLTKLSGYYSSGKLDASMLFYYSKGRISKINIDWGKYGYEEYTYKYDNKGNLITEEIRSSDGDAESYRYEYKFELLHPVDRY